MAARRTQPGALPDQSEADFQAQVVELARYSGWTLIYHTYDSRRSGPGYPDLTLCRPTDGRLLIAELKTRTGSLSVDQKAWIDGLDAVKHFDVRVWRPSDWTEIERTLTR